MRVEERLIPYNGSQAIEPGREQELPAALEGDARDTDAWCEPRERKAELRAISQAEKQQRRVEQKRLATECLPQQTAGGRWRRRARTAKERGRAERVAEIRGVARCRTAFSQGETCGEDGALVVN
eukprot:Skav203672  [mRNA]  locus=scaffold3418:131419:137315:+ [translate_table: standard]